VGTDAENVTGAPTVEGLRLDVGVVTVEEDLVTVKEDELLAAPPTVTTTLAAPIGAVFGTVVAMLDAPQLDTEAATPPKVTELLPWVDPKPDPLTVTAVPDGPVVTERLVICGLTVNAQLLE
jgi:hypothetical protein